MNNSFLVSALPKWEFNPNQMVEEVYGKGFNISNALSVPYVDLTMNMKKQKQHDHIQVPARHKTAQNLMYL